MIGRNISIITGIIALVTAFVNLFHIPTLARILAVATCCVICTLSLALWLRRTKKKLKESKSSSPKVGFILNEPSDKKNRNPISNLQNIDIGIFLILVLVAIAVVLLLRFTIIFHNVSISETVNEEFQTILIKAPYVSVSELILMLPVNFIEKCSLFEPKDDESIARLVDIESNNPRISIINFAHPQQLELRCHSKLQMSDIQTIVKPSSIQVLKKQYRNTFNFYFNIGGIILWLITLAIIFIGLRS